MTVSEFSPVSHCHRHRHGLTTNHAQPALLLLTNNVLILCPILVSVFTVTTLDDTNSSAMT